MADEAASLYPDDVVKLKEFHAAHFSSQIIPSISAGQHGVPGDSVSPADDGFGYYVDGVQRTLTDDQVRKQGFDDDRAAQQDSVQSLTYDDVPSDRSTKPIQKTTQNKQFLWPTLGRSR
ncbi:hypothetical protein DV736_g2312, partial [Chaetothyriales sp. CBS 134916]